MLAPPLRLLGPLAHAGPAGLEVVPGGRARTVLATLALDAGRAVSAGALIAATWPDALPANPAAALHTQVSRLRALLPDGWIAREAHGYRLALRPAEVDLHLAREVLERARGRPADAPELAGEALALWRGEPGADLVEGETRHHLAAAAQAVALALTRARWAGLVAAGRFAEAADELAAQVAATPADEEAAGWWMRALAGLGRANEAVAVFAALRHELREELGTDPSPELAALHESLLRGTARGGTAVGGAGAPRHRLVGRDAEVAELARLCASHRLVTVTGPAGVGKSVLARAAAAQLGAPVFAVDAAAGTADLGLALAQAARLRAPTPDLAHLVPEGADPVRAFAGFLRGRPAAVLLDNCEVQVQSCAGFAARLLAAAPHVSVLATSRTPLDVYGEHLAPLGPLGPGAAVELLRQRAEAARPGSLPDGGVAEVICAAVDRLPLAIELAAGGLRVMGAAELARQVAEGTAGLAGPARTPRHRSLADALDASWALLDTAGRDALGRLALLPAPLPRAAALALAGDGLDTLIRQSLVEVAEDGGGVRVRVLSTVRDFTLAHADAGVRAAVREWARAVAPAAVDLAAGPAAPPDPDLARNLAAALDVAFADGDGATVGALLAPLVVNAATAGDHASAGRWVRGLLALPSADSAPALAVAVGYLLLEGTPREFAAARARLRRAAPPADPVLAALRGVCLLPLGGRAAARALARRRREPLALLTRAAAAELAGLPRRAVRDLGGAVDLLGAAAPPWLVAAVELRRATVTANAGWHAQAVLRFAAAEAALRGIGADADADGAAVDGALALAAAGGARQVEGALAVLEGHDAVLARLGVARIALDRDTQEGLAAYRAVAAQVSLAGDRYLDPQALCVLADACCAFCEAGAVLDAAPLAAALRVRGVAHFQRARVVDLPLLGTVGLALAAYARAVDAGAGGGRVSALRALCLRAGVRRRYPSVGRAALGGAALTGAAGFPPRGRLAAAITTAIKALPG